ncbi:MAG: hypothetical protein OP8BY_0340 [Candidatus Saccharicenans subterraneus]|uniref:Outer membrane protein beta-barrel domain-containing protein n=1 Tax=Candidatus Saccharicenans subterraneus TaxID=2508984 RepID=A0A3E2BL35_9BACT|nr:MAG: hypothetical protein OP8BY_0340 [Candidatus Saccharicenans subterraneum]
MPKSAVRTLGSLFISFMVLSSPLLADGNLEFNVHYSYWTLNVVRGLVEKMVSDTLENDLKDRFLQQIQADYPTLVERGYQQDVNFDAPGHNIGFELRFYPGGRGGAFSLGLAVEQTTMKISFPSVTARLDLVDLNLNQTATYNGQAGGEFIIKPLSFHLNMRWEFLPSKVLSPYLTIGAGISTSKSFFDARYRYEYSGTLTLPDSSTEQYSDSDTKTLRQIKDERLAEGKDFPLNFLPIFQFNLGLRARLSRALNLVADVGIFDGFLFRGGLSIRI